MQRRRPTWSGNSLVESRTGASAAQNKVPSLYYSLYYSPAPFPLEPIFTPKGAEREKGSGGEEKKICGAASEGGAAFWIQRSGVQVFSWANTCPAGVFTSSATFLQRLGIEKSFSPSVSSESCGLSLQKELKDRKETETKGEAEEKSILLDVR